MIKTIPFYQSLINEGTTTEILLYGLIEVLSYEKGFCYASNKYLGKQLGISEKSVPVILSNIKKKGWVKTQLNETGSRDYILPMLGLKEKSDDEGLMCIKGGLIDINGGFNEDLSGGLMSIKHILKNNIKDNNKKVNKEKSFDSIFQEKEVSEKLKLAFLDFIKMRKAIGAKITPRGLELAIDKVRKLDSDELKQIEIINQSIEKSWRGLFPLSENTGNLKIYEL